MFETNFRVDGLLLFISFIISLIFEYFPKLDEWYNNLTDDKQKAIMFLVILFASGGSFFFSCVGWLDWYVCEPLSIRDVIVNFLLALSVNQSTHRMLVSRQGIKSGFRYLLGKS